MSGHAAPSAEELLERAHELVPFLQSKALWAEDNRRPHDEVVEALAGAGMYDLRRPARYGGYESAYHTMVDVFGVLAAGDGSIAWNAGVWATGGWLAAQFPDYVQDEIFARPAVRICAALSPTAEAAVVPGGLRVSGQWRFMSGARHSHWQVIIAMAPAPGGGQWPVAGLVPMNELEIVDDWDSSGLAGTGSVTTIARDVLVPDDRVLPMPVLLEGQGASEVNAAAPVFRTPMMPTGAAGLIGVAVGMAKATRDQFFERLPSRKIAYTAYASQAAAPVTHLQAAEAALKIDEAEFHAHRMADLLDDKGVSGMPWKTEERVRNRGWLGRVVQQSREAVEILSTASGGSSVYRSVPIQRIQRDMRALTMHGLMYPAANFEVYGRGLCGLEPDTAYL